MQVKQTIKEERHSLVDYVNDSQGQACMQVKNGNFLNAQERKHEYQNYVIKTQTESWQGKTVTWSISAKD